MNNSDDRIIIRRLRSSVIPFGLLFLFFLFLGLYVAKPLAPGLAWAAVLSFFTYPLYCFIYKRVLRGKHSYLAAAINTMLILFLLVLPMITIGGAAVREATKLYSVLQGWILQVRGSAMDSVLALPPFAWFLSRFPQLADLPIWKELLYNSASMLASLTTSLSKEVLGNALKILFNLLVITVASFFITHDGDRFVSFIKDLLPFSPSSRDEFFVRGKRMLYSIFYGIMMTAAIQGTLGAMGWWFVGLDNPVFFGILMFLFAILPFVGTPIIWGPGVIYLFTHGDTKGGLILLLWGLLIVSSIDNVLRPLFISEGSKAHILLVFVGILGGLATWGFLGLFLGPLVLSLAAFFLQMYRLFVIAPPEETMEEAESESK